MWLLYGVGWGFVFFFFGGNSRSRSASRSRSRSRSMFRRLTPRLNVSLACLSAHPQSEKEKNTLLEAKMSAAAAAPPFSNPRA